MTIQNIQIYKENKMISLWIWERTRKPTVPPAIPADLRSKVLELCETIIDAEDCGALVDDVMDFNLPRQIREMMGEA